MYKYQKYALNASRYNLNNARASAAYSAANFYNDLAAATALGSYKTSRRASSRPTASPPAPRHLTPAMRRQLAGQARSQMIPRDKLIDSSGRVLWPTERPDVPSNLAQGPRPTWTRRSATASDDLPRTGGPRSATWSTPRTSSATTARKALDHLKSDQPAEANGLATFLASLDYALTTMGDGHRPVGADHTTPRQRTEDRRRGPQGQPQVRPRDRPNPRARSPTTRRSSGGDILKNSTKPASGRTALDKRSA